MSLTPMLLGPSSREIADVDLVELYFERGWTYGLPVVPPTQDKINAVVQVLGGDADYVECKVAPRWGALTREVLAINMVMAGCKPKYAPVVRAAMLALTDAPFNLNGVQATTHMASPLVKMEREQTPPWRVGRAWREHHVCRRELLCEA
jgi:hypothetical protein